MKNEIKIRKKRFLAILLVMLIVLKSLPPISVRAEAVYDLAELYEMSEYPVLNPGDTLSNSGETSCVISYYDYGEYGEELISNRIDQGMSHTVFDYPGNLPDGVEFSGWLISYIYASGGVIESVNLEATITIQGTEISDSLYNTILDAETVLYHGTDSYTISYYNQDGSELGEMVQIDANIPYKVIDYPSTIPEGSTFAGWQVSYIYVSGGSGTLNLTAQFELKQYTIKFVNENGEELKRCELTYGEIPTYSGKTPVKEATAQYTYTFAGWTPEIGPVTGDATYTATYTETTNKYIVKFVDEDGEELQSGELVYGETPVYRGETPVKEATAEYSYTFAGWTPEITTVTGNATYTAVFEEIKNKYAVKFVDEEGRELYSSEVAYGEIPTYQGETPVKEATAEHSYTFAGWTPEITAVNGNATYTAVFTENTNQYTITFDTDGGSEIAPITQEYGTPVTAPEDPTKAGYEFAGWTPAIPATMPAENMTITALWDINRYTVRFVNEDGEELTSSEVAYGEKPEYQGETPVKEATAEYSYTFTGWSPKIGPVTEDVTYTAVFEEIKNKYTVKFMDEEGRELHSSEVAYGEIPTYQGETPVKEATAEHSYTFAGWTPEITAVTGNATYTAVFTENTNQYTITFDTDGGSEIAPITQEYGTPVTAPEDPTKAGYEFAGWTPAIPATMPAENMTITALWDINRYTVRFVNEDGEELTSSEVAYGEKPEYQGETPVKEATAEYSYTFTGWSPKIGPVTEDVTYTAVFEEIKNKYIVKFVDEDGRELHSSEVAYGETPTYQGETPVKEATAEYSYNFEGWTPEITAVTGNATYTAVFTESANQYTITFNTDGGSEIAPITQAYGTPVKAPADPTRAGYKFAGWNPAIPTSMPAENMTIKAQWTAESYHIYYVLNGGTNSSNPDSYTYGTGVEQLSDALKVGYRFAGWYENADFSGDRITSIASNRTGDITLYAKFEMGTLEANSYNLTAGIQYKLGNVTRVSGDSSVYAPGITFYVPVSGTYRFE